MNKFALNKAPQKGFTLVELLVSVGIFTIITSVAAYNHSLFNGSVILTNLAYEIALSIRQAQFYGITVRQSADDSTRFDSGYGIHFDTVSAPASYILFEDKPAQDHVYNVGESLNTFSIQRGNTISKIVVSNGSGTTSKSLVDISFIRPNPDTYITADGIAGVYYNNAELCVSSPQANKRKIIIEATGQISVSSDVAGVCN